MQFDRDASGKLTPLPKPSIDTGAGLERMTAVLQSVISNYDTDLFSDLIRRAAVFCNVPGCKLSDFDYHKLEVSAQASLRIIADHARATTFLISDGVVPSNEGRGYVLRKIMRRAMRHARLLGGDFFVLTNMVQPVCLGMKDAYPEVSEKLKVIERVVRAEETRFEHTIAEGLKRLESDLDVVFARRAVGEEIVEEHATGESSRSPEFIAGERTLLSQPPFYPGEQAFKLYDTFGLPVDFIQDAVRDRSITFDQAGFDRAMAEQQARARASWKGAAKQTANPAYQQLPKVRVRRLSPDAF
jgi:alanyl-tRNA synthetase